MYSYLVDDNSEYKNVVATISHDKCKNVLLNKKYLKHSMNKIQCRDIKIGTYKSIRLLCLLMMINYTSKTIDVMD